MDKSFTTWRESRKPEEVEHDSDDDQDLKLRKNELLTSNYSDSDSSIVSSSRNEYEVADSDESFIDSKNITSGFDEKRIAVVPDSDDQESSDEFYAKNFSSLSGNKSQTCNKNSSGPCSNSFKSSTSKLSDKDESSPEITKSVKRKNKKFVIASDNESDCDVESVTGNFNISDVLSEEEIFSTPSLNKVRSLINDKNSSESNFNISDVLSEEESVSTPSLNKAGSLINDKNSSESSTSTYKISDSEDSPHKVNQLLETSKSKRLPTIDLTLPISHGNTNCHKKTVIGNIDLTSSSKNAFDSPTTNKGIITIGSDTEDSLSHELSTEEKLSEQLTKVNISKHESSKLPYKENNKATSDKPSAFQTISENDYSSRLESMMAEQTRLDAQVKEVLKRIDNVKSTLRTANVAALPDRGVRLQVDLKKYESKLRDLRYQQNTLSNEIIRLQMMPKVSSAPKPIQSQMPQQKMYKLPTTTTDINVMGKRALETHRAQQALTVDALRALHNSLKNCPSENTLASDPAGLKVELMPHQKYALSWLLWREKEKPSGGILADDMGLGKTLTMIALILKSNEERKNSESDDSGGEDHGSSSGSNWLSSQRDKLIPGKTLVVCPASLLGQWEGEAQRRVQRGTIDVHVHHGQDREKKARRLARPDLVITTYNILSRDSEKSESPLFQIKWGRVILDEAHQIRNHKTKTAQAVFQLKAHSRWVLTGTPIQNKELDLYALLKFLRCSPFDDLSVWKAWVDNRDAAGKQRLDTIIKSIMLRRTKKGLQEGGELKNLPDKHFNTVMIKLDKEEWAVYEKLLNYSKTLFATFLHQKALKENALQGVPLNTRKLQEAEDPFKDHPELARLHRQMKEITSDVKSHHILVLLLRLRQFCCHPSLIQTMLEKDDISNVGIEDSDGIDIDLMDKMSRMSLANVNKDAKEDTTDLTAMDKDNPLFSKDRLSSKLRKVIEVIEDILPSNDKLLVVSQWVTYLDLVQAVLEEKKVKCSRLTGKIPVKDRAEIVDKFNRKDRGPRVLLLSLTAGGVGLNLVGANHLLLLDLHWNPQLENQACDRIYRVGQEKTVQIYKFVTNDTVEETVLSLQEKKLGIADAVLTGGANRTLSKLTLDDLKMLFKIQ